MIKYTWEYTYVWGPIGSARMKVARTLPWLQGQKGSYNVLISDEGYDGFLFFIRDPGQSEAEQHSSMNVLH